MFPLERKPAPISGPSLALRNGTAPLRVAGGPEGGTYEVVAGGLQKVGQGADVAVLPMRTAGSLSNLLALATGHAELAIVLTREEQARKAAASADQRVETARTEVTP